MIKGMGLLRYLAIIAVFLCIAVPAAAAQSNAKPKAITIEPFLQEVILNPADASKTFDIRVTNNTGSDFRFSLEPVDFGSLNETGGVFFTGTKGVELGGRYGLADWVELDRGTRTLPAGQTVEINVTLLNRSDLSPGGHYGAIFINSADARAGGDQNVSFRQSISALVLAIKRGGEKYDLSLNNVSTNGSLLKRPDQVTLRFRNNGNTHVVPRGTVTISDGGDIISRGTINESSSYVLPETFRQVPVELRNQRSHPLELVKSYAVEVNYRYDGLDRFATKTYTIRWINLPAVFFWAAVLTAIGLATYPYAKKYFKRIKFKKLFR